ncbi:hypothetical protein CTI12_AA392310 [Artemisia annua]|uniref:Signal peptidase complex subunit 2 n=1 Tax=Artemisia annua TaxID=35608 RepID=A0A2U1MD40_ARTAN|nr:hypothetical protein CTI12_AA392310 [Artemisia annua]
MGNLEKHLKCDTVEPVDPNDDSGFTELFKTNLLDHHSIKHLLDETVTEVVTNKGYGEDVRMSNLIVYTKEKNAFLFTYPHVGSAYTSTGLMVSSKLPRFSDMYTLTIASADPKSISAKPTVEFTKSVTKWFTKMECWWKGYSGKTLRA